MASAQAGCEKLARVASDPPAAPRELASGAPAAPRELASHAPAAPPAVTSPAPAAPHDVLAQRTRARLFRCLARHGHPVDTGALAAELGLHPSGVRVHLERLRRAGLVSRELVAQSRGRPRYAWQISSEARPGSDPPDAYRRLAGWLARSIPARPGRLREVQRAGRQLGRELAPRPRPAGAAEALGRALTALGFAPQRCAGQDGELTFRLGNCPYCEAVCENQEVVCALHHGLTLGLLDALAPAARLSRFVPHDPRQAGCVLAVAGLAAEGGGDEQE